MPRADISSDPSTTSQARLVRETTPERRRHGRHGNLSASLLRPPNLVACDLSGGFEFVSAMGLWDLYLPIAASLGPRPRRGRRRCAVSQHVNDFPRHVAPCSAWTFAHGGVSKDRLRTRRCVQGQRFRCPA